MNGQHNEEIVRTTESALGVPKNEECDIEISKSIKKLDDSLGELYRSLCYLKETETKPSRKVKDSETDRLSEGNGSISQSSHEDGEDKEDQEDKVRDMSPVNKQMVRLSLKMNGNRQTSSMCSEADSGIGTATPKRASDVIWTRLEDMPSSPASPASNGSPRILRNGSTLRSNRSYNFEQENFVRNSPGFKSSRSFDVENYILSRLSPTCELRAFDAASLRSLTIPMGCSDGKKIIQRSETSPEDLLNLPAK